MYIALVRQSRNPFFYTECAVPDTLDGRFDLILLHLFRALRPIREQNDAGPRTRQLMECLFDDMDRSLREMGVGDMGVGKRVKSMSKAAYGRLTAYGQAWGDDMALKEALVRNLYRGVDPGEAVLGRMVEYIRGFSV